MNLKRKRKRNKKRVNNIIYLFGVTKQNPQKIFAKLKPPIYFFWQIPDVAENVRFPKFSQT